MSRHGCSQARKRYLLTLILRPCASQVPGGNHLHHASWPHSCSISVLVLDAGILLRLYIQFPCKYAIPVLGPLRSNSNSYHNQGDSGLKSVHEIFLIFIICFTLSWVSCVVCNTYIPCESWHMYTALLNSFVFHPLSYPYPLLPPLFFYFFMFAEQNVYISWVDFVHIHNSFPLWALFLQLHTLTS